MVQDIVVDCYTVISIEAEVVFFAHQPTYFYPFLALHAWNCDIFRVWENASSHLSLRFFKPTNRPSDQPTEMSIQHFQNDKFTYISTVLFVEHPFGIMLCHSSTKWTAAILSFLLRLQQDAIYGMEIYVLITNCIFHLVNSVQCKMVRANFKANETLTMRYTKHEKIEYKKRLKLSLMGFLSFRLNGRINDWKLSLHSINATIYHQRFYFNAIHLINFGIVHFEYYTFRRPCNMNR